jgi:3-dehydroquinate synthase
MSLIERTVQLSFQQRVFFTKYVFALSNPLLAEVLTNERSTQVPKVLIVLDESLHVAQPGLVRNIEAYFAAQAQRIKLVCPPMILEGGERVKNSYFHVSEIQSHIDRYHMDRHS